MLIAVLFLGAATIGARVYTYKSWILPMIVKHENAPFEPGRDSEVSPREMRRRSVWRYDSWTDRIMAGLCDVALIAAWFFLLIGK